MTSIKVADLPARLEAVAGMVVTGRAMIDVGTDHALLPAALVGGGVVPRALAIDKHEGPLAHAAHTVDERGVAERVELRLGDGLQAIAAEHGGVIPDEFGTIVIAGMGARSVQEILTGLRFAGRIVLQANGGFPHLGTLRRFLQSSGWAIVAEDLVLERDQYYVVIAAEPGPVPAEMTAAQLELGPRLLARRPPHPLLEPFLEDQRRRNDRAIAGLLEGSSPDDAALARRRDYERLLDGALAGLASSAR